MKLFARLPRISVSTGSRIITGLLLALPLLFLSVCGKSKSYDPRIGLIGAGEAVATLEEALARMGEKAPRIGPREQEKLGQFDLIILARGAYSDSATGLAEHNPALLDFVRSGGGLLIFGLEEKGWSSERLPWEVRFAADDPSGWGNYDFSERIEKPDHSLFNSPHRLNYLAGLEELDRIVYTAPQWRILLSKDPGHPESDARLEKLDCSVGSIFEADYGSGRILVCQPIIERYFAGRLQITPHPLEQGVLLFENLIEYMKRKSAARPLPLAIARAVPSRGDAGEPVNFSVGLAEAGQGRCAWDFGDGTTGSGLSLAHSYQRPGVYWAVATVTDSSGAVDHAACRVEVGPGKPMRWADELVSAQMHRYYPDPSRVGVNYRTALFLTGMLDVYERSRNPEILAYVDSFFTKRLLEKWETRPYKDNLEPDVNFVDIYSLMAPAYRLYKLTGKNDYLRICQEVWGQSLAVDRSLPAGSLLGPWNWHGRKAIVDFTYFNVLFRATAWRETGSISLLDEAADQMLRYTRTFMDPADSLFFQAVDLDHNDYYTSPSRPSGLNDSKWGRANGWVALAFTELMAALPEKHSKRAELTRIINAFFTGIVRTQDPKTGLWAQVTDKLDSPGMWLETSSSGMFVYSLCRLTELGVLPSEPFLTAARKGYNGLQQRVRLGAFGYPYLSDGCQGTMPRVNLQRWIETHREDNGYHAVGPFLMAEEAVWRVAPPKVGVVGTLRPGQSSLGQILTLVGTSFHQIPSLFNPVELSTFETIHVDNGAFDRNDADILAYSKKLLEYAGNGGVVIYFSQQDRQALLKALPPGLSFKEDSDKSCKVEFDGNWKRVVVKTNLGNFTFYRIAQGKGYIMYCDNDLRDFPSGGKSLALVR